ncbi:MAG: tRNA epoxyqueuosine(34) reductase QueG [Planctomycetes bacterium]|nr:tRNA epoxyqueuosine(34) reductase QueG [Planctomycetota bacterium]
MAPTLSQQIIDRCLTLDFAAAGVAPAAPTKWSKHILEWLEGGKHGSMAYLAADMELRFDPRKVMEGTRSFLVVADLYSARGHEVPSRLGEPTPMGRIARYAQGRDYHHVMKRRLHSLADALRLEIPGCDFRTCVDTVPILERELAVAAGIGWQAKNTMVIHPRLGSYLLLGVVATTLELEPPAEQWTATDHCGTCTRCIEACPTQAITPYGVDGSRCISYLTIEHRTPIDPSLHAAIGDWMYGCDVCQEVCPHNSAREGGNGTPHAAYTPRLVYLNLAEVMDWTGVAREEAFRTSPMKRARLDMMKRNAVIVAGNALATGEHPGLRERLEALAGNSGETELVRQTAADVLRRVGHTG